MVKEPEDLLQITNRRFDQQAAIKADRLSVKAELAKANYQLTTIEDTLADSKEGLNHLLGRSVQTEFAVEPVPATSPEQEDLSASRATALYHRPEMKLAANRVRQAELSTRSEKTHYIPDIAIQASYFSPANINFLPQNIGTVGALLTWQRWDWREKRLRGRQTGRGAHRADSSV